MVWLPDSEKISKIFLFVLAQLTNVTDGQTDGHRMPTYTALMHMHLAVKTTRMHQKSPFGDLKSKHFLGRGHCPSPDPFLSWERDTPSPHLTPSAPTVPRLSRLRRSTSAFDVPHPHYFFTHPQSSFSRNMPVDMSISFDTIQACDRQTDRRTDGQIGGQTDRWTDICDSIVRAMYAHCAVIKVYQQLFSVPKLIKPFLLDY